MDRLKLFTLQSYDLTKFRGPIRLELGTYRNDPRIIAAQRELNARLHENQLIWMSQTYPYLSSNHLGHFVNEVNVDHSDIAAIVDGMVWNHIIHDDPRYLPPEEHAALREKAEFDPIQDFAVALRKAEDEYLGRRLPGDLWTGVCKRSIEFQSDQVLVRFPLTFSEVLRVDLVAQEMTDHSKRRRR